MRSETALAPFDPVIAFGLRAVALAMKAKTGQMKRGEAQDLLDCHQLLIPEDDCARDAVMDFAYLAAVDQAAAGVRLHDFILGWRAGAVGALAAETEAALRDQAGDQFDWQARKDCGHD